MASREEMQPGLPIVRRNQSSGEEFYNSVWGRIFNARHDERLPRAVVNATKSLHVKAAIELAIEEECRVAVRSGGHSWAAWSVRDDSILIDLGGMKEMEYNPDTEVVRCSPSITGKILNSYLGQKERMFCGGHCPDVGLGGFLLQGGMGWNCKNWGWACESIVGLDVVTADAKELHCDKDENSDLFWAAKGSGPGFPAVVTQFYLLTRPLSEMFQSVYFYPVSSYHAVLQWVIDACPHADPDTEVVCVGGYFPGSDEIQILANFTCFKHSHDEAVAALRPLHLSRPPATTEIFCKRTSLADQYCAQAEANPPHHRYSSDNAYIRNDADVPSVLQDAFTTLPTRKSFSLYFSMNPCSRRKLPDMALSMQSDHYFAMYTVWEAEEDDETCISWQRNVMKHCARDSVGSYLGDADFRVRNAKYWGSSEAKRLATVRQQWDSSGRIAGYLDAGDKGGVLGLRNMVDCE